MTRPILLVGAGRMGGALLKGWLAKGLRPKVVEPNPSTELRELVPQDCAADRGKDWVWQAKVRP